eukprot:gene14773-20822_t
MPAAASSANTGIRSHQATFDLLWSVSFPELWGMLRDALHSETAIFIALNWFFAVCTAVGLITMSMFLERLSQRESARMAERLVKYIVHKFAFLGALSFGSDPREMILWLVWFYVVGFWRVFSGAARDRLEALAVSPRSQPSLQARAISLLLVIMGQDVVCIYALKLALQSGLMPRSYVLLCVFDAAIIFLESTKGLLVYGTHVIDHRIVCYLFRRKITPDSGPAAASWEAWEGKGSFLYHVELIMDTAVHILTLCHYVHIWLVNGLRFKLVDIILCLDVRAVVLSAFRRFKAYASYRAATHCLQHSFPDAKFTSSGAADGNVPGGLAHECSICMETMAQAKQLPCGRRQPLLGQPPRGVPPVSPHGPLLRRPSLQPLQPVYQRDSTLMGSLGRVRQRLGIWVLAAAVGLVAAAIQGAEPVVVHPGRGGSHGRGGPGRRSSRPAAAGRSRSSRRRLSKANIQGEDAAGESADSHSDLEYEEAVRYGTQEPEAGSWWMEGDHLARARVEVVPTTASGVTYFGYRFYPPRFEVPRFDAPHFDAPRFEVPRFDAPHFDAPRFEVPRFDAPHFDTSRFQVPRFDAPHFDAPRFEVPRFDAPHFDASRFQVPRFDAPHFAAPRFEVPWFDAPHFEVPRFDVPRFDVPTFDAPRWEAPHFDAPRFDVPTFEAPRFDVPSFDAPRWEAPRFEAPRFDVPTFDAPRFDVPRWEAPRFDGPETWLGEDAYRAFQSLHSTLGSMGLGSIFGHHSDEEVTGILPPTHYPHVEVPPNIGRGGSAGPTSRRLTRSRATSNPPNEGWDGWGTGRRAYRGHSDMAVEALLLQREKVVQAMAQSAPALAVAAAAATAAALARTMSRGSGHSSAKSVRDQGSRNDREELPEYRMTSRRPTIRRRARS